jgi:hypothetical protein
MRRLLFVGSLLFLAVPALAQESYSFSATAAQVARINRARMVHNVAVCFRFNLAATCTQAQACTAAQAPGGAACTAAQARSANVRIYPATQAGREEAMIFEGVVPWVNSSASGVRDFDHLAYCTWYNDQNQATKDGECTKIGVPAPCDLCTSP